MSLYADNPYCISSNLQISKSANLQSLHMYVGLNTLQNNGYNSLMDPKVHICSHIEIMAEKGIVKKKRNRRKPQRETRGELNKSDNPPNANMPENWKAYNTTL
jgi:hypothetical protein